MCRKKSIYLSPLKNVRMHVLQFKNARASFLKLVKWFSAGKSYHRLKFLKCLKCPCLLWQKKCIVQLKSWGLLIPFDMSMFSVEKRKYDVKLRSKGIFKTYFDILLPLIYILNLDWGTNVNGISLLGKSQQN